MKESSFTPAPQMEVDNDGSNDSSSSYSSTISILKEQIEFLHQRISDKQGEIDGKSRVIDQLHTEKRIYQEKYENADFNSFEMRERITTLVG